MKKLFAGMLFGVFILFGGIDAHALEMDQVLDKVREGMTNIDASNVAVKVEYICDTEGTCDSTNANQFVVETKNKDGETFRTVFDFTNEYILYQNPYEQNHLEKYEQEFADNIAYSIMLISVTDLFGYSITFDVDLSNVPLSYEESGFEVSNYTYEYEQDNTHEIISGVKTLKVNYKDGFAAAAEKIRTAPKGGTFSLSAEGSYRSLDEDTESDSDSSEVVDSNANSQGIVNPSTGDLNMTVIGVLGILAMFGIVISTRKVFE